MVALQALRVLVLVLSSASLGASELSEVVEIDVENYERTHDGVWLIEFYAPCAAVPPSSRLVCVRDRNTGTRAVRRRRSVTQLCGTCVIAGGARTARGWLPSTRRWPTTSIGVRPDRRALAGSTARHTPG